MFPASRSGKTRTLARPASGEPGCLALADLDVERGVDLHLAVGRNIRRQLAESLGGRAHPLYSRARPRSPSCCTTEMRPVGVPDQARPVARGGERDLGELVGAGFGNDGAVGEREDGVSRHHHVEGGADQSHPRRRPNGPERGADRLRRGYDRTRDGAVGLTERHQCRAEVDGDGSDIQRVDTVRDAIGPALAKKLGDPAESWIVARLGTGAPEKYGLGDAVLPQPLSRLLHPRVGSLAQHDPAPMGRGPLEQSLQKAHGRNRADSAAATAGCTSALTSPPKRATSRTRLELR